MWKYTIRVNGMICEKCENNVNDAVRKTFSVKEVTSSYSKNETTVIAENKLDENVLRQVITAAGYQVMSVQLTPMRVKSDVQSESKTMLNVFLSWVSWECTKLPADGAEVQILDGKGWITGEEGPSLCVARSQYTKLKKTHAPPLRYGRWVAFALKCAWEDLRRTRRKGE